MIEDVYLVFTYWRVTFNFNFSLCYLPGQFRTLGGWRGGGGEGVVKGSLFLKFLSSKFLQ